MTYATAYVRRHWVQDVVERLVWESCWFSATPLPNDEYMLSVKVDSKHALVTALMVMGELAPDVREMVGR